MATTTATPAQADPLDQLREARVALDHGRAERARLGERRDAYADKIRNAPAELDRIAGTDTDQFDNAGTPKKGTVAHKLRQQIDQPAQSKWPVVIEGSDQRVHDAERRVRELTKRYAVVLARSEHDAGCEAIERVRALAGETRHALAQVRAPEAALVAITTALGTAIDGRNVWTDARVDELERSLDAAEQMLPPRLPDLTPYHGETPRVFVTVDGSWVLARSAHQAELGAPPEPIEPPS